jgi:hypothetical protein
MKRRTLSSLLLVAGIALLVLGYFEPQIKARFATVVADNTPPVFVVATLSPKDGAVYGAPISTIQAGVNDLESGVTSVVASIDGTAYVMQLRYGDAYQGAWYWSLVTAISAEGQHSITYVATNGVGLQTTYTGSFSISTVVQGTWHINGEEITSPDQIVYSSSLTVTFTFSKTSGPTITSCSIVEGGTTLLTLASVDSSTWSGSFTFVGGKHTLALTATTGTGSFIMATLNLDLGGFLNFATEQIVMFGAGACCLGAGGYLRLPKKKGLVRVRLY